MTSFSVIFLLFPTHSHIFEKYYNPLNRSGLKSDFGGSLWGKNWKIVADLKNRC
jgi:hypothetical protein